MAAFRALHRPFHRPLSAHLSFFLSNRTFSTTLHIPTSCTIPLPFSFLASKSPFRPASTLHTFVPTTLLCPAHLRTYIRPHYYNDGHNPLSSALRRNRNPLVRLWRRLDDTNPNTVIWFMIGVNFCVFSAWQYAVGSLRQFRDPQWLQFMHDNFVVNPANISEGRLHTIITSAFSHLELPHFGVNMIVLYSIGSAVCGFSLLGIL
ncbi:hypothetical protein BC937DRAFT_93838 [Endogone sp. FLAS-F59071]|nr:hypothetical protein BC937DRAFT_93838 [Endogone sp. FLAS-F59071]|eukprot:RUS21018.1 hypothetical protein BC937DRAFT_93838 [Endogone sp. FLAS-F59071]